MVFCVRVVGRRVGVVRSEGCRRFWRMFGWTLHPLNLGHGGCVYSLFWLVFETAPHISETKTRDLIPVWRIHRSRSRDSLNIDVRLMSLSQSGVAHLGSVLYFLICMSTCKNILRASHGLQSLAHYIYIFARLLFDASLDAPASCRKAKPS